MEENEKVSTEASLKEMDTLLELNITEVDAWLLFVITHHYITGNF